MITDSTINVGSKFIDVYGIPGIILVAFFIICYFLFKYFSEALKRKDDTLEKRAADFSAYVMSVEQKRDETEKRNNDRMDESEKRNSERVEKITNKFDETIKFISKETKEVLEDLKGVIDELREEIHRGRPNDKQQKD